MNDPMDRSAGRERLLYGLYTRKACWRLSWWGRILIPAVVVVVTLTLAHGVHPFLAVNDRLETPVVVMEGWIADYAVQETSRRFGGGDTRIMTTGGPLRAGVNLDPDDTYAHVAGRRLVAFGVAPESIAMVPSPGGQRDRTYSSALALREWFDASGECPSAINVVTLGVHARRTRLLFRRAFGRSTDVGIIAIENREYDQEKWWRYSEGVKEVLSEGAAYIYAKFLFFPEK